MRQARLELQAKQRTEQRTAVHVLDLRYTLWTLQTSVDGLVRLSALEYFAAMTLDDFNPIQIVTGWFDVFINCVQVTNGNVIIVPQGLEQLAATSSMFCLHTLPHLMIIDLMSTILEDIRQRYTRSFPFKASFDSLPFPHVLYVIHRVLCPNRTEGSNETEDMFPPICSLSPSDAAKRQQRPCRL